MILKGSQRAFGADLATHLMNAFDNEHVEIAEITGTVAGDLHGAFAEFEAIAAGTRAREYLYSLSINPSAPLTREQYFEAIDVIEARIDLRGQPRAVVFHVKNGREHCHVVWSRIDMRRMRAVHLSHDHRKLCDLACALAERFGLDLPPGLKAWQAREKYDSGRLEPTLAENAQTQATGITPDQRQAEITAAYEESDTPQAFLSALADKGYVLARGDRRGLVVVGRFGHIHSLTRYIKGHKAKAIKARLAGIHLEGLPMASEVRERQKAELADRAPPVPSGPAWQEALAALKVRQAARRRPLDAKAQDMLIRHAAERLALHAAQQTERQGPLFRAAAAIVRLIVRTPGLRSVLGPIARSPRLNPAQRHALEIKAVAERHARERAAIERERHSLTAVETRELRSLERTFRRQAGESAGRILRHEHEQLQRLEAPADDPPRDQQPESAFRQEWSASADPAPRPGGKIDLRVQFARAARDEDESGDGDKEELAPQSEGKTRRRKPQRDHRQADAGTARGPRHEQEDLHRLQAHLTELRRDMEAAKTLRQNFNERTGSRKGSSKHSQRHRVRRPRKSRDDDPGGKR